MQSKTLEGSLMVHGSTAPTERSEMAQRTGRQQFEQAVTDQSRAEANVLVEFWTFLRDNKKWWLLPLVLIILVQVFLVMLASSAAAPFIYPLF